MKSLKNKLISVLKDESAQGATEYILLLVVVVAIAMMFKTQIMAAITQKMGQVNGDIQGFTP
jgi:hypothetical protein